MPRSLSSGNCLNPAGASRPCTPGFASRLGEPISCQDRPRFEHIKEKGLYAKLMSRIQALRLF